jgi:hypothetical protein
VSAGQLIPEYIEVDMLDVTTGDIIHISDLKLPEGVVPPRHWPWVKTTTWPWPRSAPSAVAPRKRKATKRAGEAGSRGEEEVRRGGSATARSLGIARRGRGQHHLPPRCFDRRPWQRGPQRPLLTPLATQTARTHVSTLSAHRRPRKPRGAVRGTRHNAGEDFVRELARQAGGTLRRDSKYFGEVGEVLFAGHKLRLLIPTPS